MALPTLVVTPGTGATVNTLPSANTADTTSLSVSTPLAATSTPTNVSGATSSTSILASNTARKKYSVFNDSTAVLYLLENSGTASATNYTLQIAAGGFYATNDWNGAVKAIWASATGTARVMEYTA